MFQIGCSGTGMAGVNIRFPGHRKIGKEFVSLFNYPRSDCSVTDQLFQEPFGKVNLTIDPAEAELLDHASSVPSLKRLLVGLHGNAGSPKILRRNLEAFAQTIQFDAHSGRPLLSFFNRDYSTRARGIGKMIRHQAAV